MIRSVLLAGVLIGGLTLSTQAQDKGSAKGGGQKLIQAKPIAKAVDAQKLKQGDTIVSACPKCKTMNYTRIDGSAKGGGLGQTKDSSACPACDSKLNGDSAKHLCKLCGGEMMCCVVPSADKHDTH